MQDVTAQPEANAGHQAAADVRGLLRALGADADIVRRVYAWETLRGEPHVYVPPLPAALIGRLVQLLPEGVTS